MAVGHSGMIVRRGAQQCVLSLLNTLRAGSMCLGGMGRPLLTGGVGVHGESHRSRRRQKCLAR